MTVTAKIQMSKHSASRTIFRWTTCRAWLCGIAVLGWGLHGTALAQRWPTTPAQEASAARVAAQGVPLSDLADNAPDSYRVKSGDTLWDISGLFLKKPWRWPELWGMNKDQIRNPHLIYPNQVLYLIKKDGFARLGVARDVASSSGSGVVRLSPHTRYSDNRNAGLPTVQMHLIEPFLVEPTVIDDLTLQTAARLVATPEDRVILAMGDRAYALGSADQPLHMGAGAPRNFRVFREAQALKDPNNGQILGYEASFLGRALLEREEGLTPALSEKDLTAETAEWIKISARRAQTIEKDGVAMDRVPASLTILSSKEEMRVGDRILPEPERALGTFVPHAPTFPVTTGRIAKIYESISVNHAGRNSVVALNMGTQDGLEAGHVLSLRTQGQYVLDPSSDPPQRLRLPQERNGVMIVFKTFPKVSYALILNANLPVKTGDVFTNPE